MRFRSAALLIRLEGGENGSPCLYDQFYGGRRDRPGSPRRLAIFAAGVEVMLTNLLPTDVVSSGRFTGNVQRPSEGAVPQPLDRRRGFSSKHNEPAGRDIRGLRGGRAGDAACATVEISPPHIVRRHIFALEGMRLRPSRPQAAKRLSIAFAQLVTCSPFARRARAAMATRSSRGCPGHHCAISRKSSRRTGRPRISRAAGAADQWPRCVFLFRSGQDADASAGRGLLGHAPEPRDCSSRTRRYGIRRSSCASRASAPAPTIDSMSRLSVSSWHTSSCVSTPVFVRWKLRCGAASGLAAADRHLVSRGTFFRADTTRHARTSRSFEPALFLPRVQAIPWNAAAPISQ